MKIKIEKLALKDLDEFFEFFGTEKKTYFGLDHHMFGKLIGKPNEKKFLEK